MRNKTKELIRLMNSIDYDEWKEHHFALAMSLIKQGANINTQDERGTTFLMEMVRWGNLDYLHTLLKAGADPNIKNELGESALLWAAHVK